MVLQPFQSVQLHLSSIREQHNLEERERCSAFTSVALADRGRKFIISLIQCMLPYIHLLTWHNMTVPDCR